MAGRLSRIAIAGLILWALWGARVFWPAHEELPAGTVRLTSLEALSAAEVGQALAIEGKVYPADTEAGELWKERFAYRLAISRKDEFGSMEEVVRSHVRPAIRFEWAGGSIAVPADTYNMKAAPEAPGDSVMLTTERNVGFRIGDEAVALCRKVGDGRVVVDALTLAPLEAYVKTLDRDNSLRAWIGHGLRVIVSLFALSMILSAFKREPQKTEALGADGKDN